MVFACVCVASASSSGSGKSDPSQISRGTQHRRLNTDKTRHITLREDEIHHQTGDVLLMVTVGDPGWAGCTLLWSPSLRCMWASFSFSSSSSFASSYFISSSSSLLSFHSSYYTNSPCLALCKSSSMVQFLLGQGERIIIIITDQRIYL